MPGMKIKILGVQELAAKLDKLPVEAADIAIAEVQEYLLNVMRSDQPTKKFISRAAAYDNVYAISPVTQKKIRGFFSWKQFKFVSMLYSQGMVPYKRSQDLSKGWHMVKGQKGIFGKLVNYVPYAVYVYGERKQSRHEAMVGWKKPSQQIADRMTKINAIIDGAAKKAIRKLHLN